MRRALFVLALLLLAILVVGTVVVPGRIARLVEDSGRDATGRTVRVGDVSVRPLAGRIVLASMDVASGDGFASEYAVRFERLGVGIRARGILADPVRIDSLHIEGLHVVVEQRGLDVNVRRLAQHLAEFMADAEDGPRVQVGLVRVTGARGSLRTALGDREFTVPDVTLRDVGSETGMTLPDLWKSVLEPILTGTLLAAFR